MVRLLLSASFFLSFSALAHDTSGALTVCEQFLNPAQVRTFNFLKKLQREEDQQFPAADFVRLGAGRAVGPLAAAMDIQSLPVEMNFGRLLGAADRSRLWDVFNTYLPPIAEMEGKTIVVFVYDELSAPVMAFQAMLLEYVTHKKIPVKGVQMRVFTSQMFMRPMEAALTKSMYPHEYSLRPIAPANEVRHWFHDGLNGRDQFDYSQFHIIDVTNPQTVVPTARQPERANFAGLKSLLASH